MRLYQKRYRTRKIAKLPLENSPFVVISSEMNVKVIIEGWEVRVKGILQILSELGHIGPPKITKYTVDGRNDEFGNLFPKTSLRHLMEQLLLDDQNKETTCNNTIGGKCHTRRYRITTIATNKCP